MIYPDYSPAAWTWLGLGLVLFVVARSEFGVPLHIAGPQLFAYGILVLWVDDRATEDGDQA